MATPRVELLLIRHADTAWRAVIRPWLERERGRLVRSYVVVPTRGQAHGWKQRCLVENTALLGVEFLTPGLARKKWMAQAASEMPALARPALGRELLLLGLRAAIERRLAPLAPGEAAWGFWKSLQSDPERVLDDFDELLKAGFRAEDFPLAPLREIFGELTAWVEELGYDFAPRQSEAAALTPRDAGAPALGGRLLVCGLGAEAWGEFFNVAAFARRFDEVTVVLPEPEFRGRGALDEHWVELWQALLGVEALPVDAPEPAASCESIAAIWTGGRLPSVEPKAEVIVGKTRADEMQLVADRVAGLFHGGSGDIGVVFPRSDAAHLRLARLLTERKIPFVDLLEAAAPPPLEVRTQRALLAFYEQGARLEELLALWPMLRTLGLTELTLARAREICERLFDERQTHALATYQERLARSEHPDWREFTRAVELVLPPWPAELTLADALARFGDVCTRLNLEKPAGWAALASFAEREVRALPVRVVTAALMSFLPEKNPATGVPGRNGFARVTLTTRRRAEGLAWSHLILVEANAGVWPERRESSCWLTDEHRQVLNARGRFSLGLFTAEHRSALEKRSWTALSRDTSEQVIFSAALFDEEEPELKLGPNSWLERVLWNGRHEREQGIEEIFAGLARSPAKAGSMTADESLESWHEVWLSRRDPVRPFDEFFLSVDPARVRPRELAARFIERAVQDPAELWFEAVLGVKRVAWEPLQRTRKKALGQLAHRVLAAALRPSAIANRFGEKPPVEEARTRLAAELARMRTFWPQDCYWDSFHAELTALSGLLLEKVFKLAGGRFLAVEMPLPASATVPLGRGERAAVHGRLDLVLLDRPEWAGAKVDIVDFKTGADARLSAERMARSGASLQLGVYLAAAQSLGATAGKVWMLKPDFAGADSMDMEELPGALSQLQQIGLHLSTGRYGSLTADRSDYAPPGFFWPLACAPVANAILRRKFAVSFGVEAGEEEESHG